MASADRDKNRESQSRLLMHLRPHRRYNRWQLFGVARLSVFDGFVAEMRALSPPGLGYVKWLVMPFQFDLGPALYVAPVEVKPKYGISGYDSEGDIDDGGNIVAFASRRTAQKSSNHYLAGFQSLSLYDEVMNSLKRSIIGDDDTFAVRIERVDRTSRPEHGKYKVVFALPDEKDDLNVA